MTTKSGKQEYRKDLDGIPMEYTQRGMGRLALSEGEGRVLVIGLFSSRTPHLSPLPFRKGEAAEIAM
jgi:hypothetical protein